MNQCVMNLLVSNEMIIIKNQVNDLLKAPHFIIQQDLVISRAQFLIGWDNMFNLRPEFRNDPPDGQDNIFEKGF